MTVDFVISLMCPQHTEGGLAATSYEDVVTSTLQEALNTTKIWLRSMFRSRMLWSGSGLLRLTYSDEMAVSLLGSCKAARGLGVAIRDQGPPLRTQELRSWPEL